MDAAIAIALVTFLEYLLNPVLQFMIFVRQGSNFTMVEIAAARQLKVGKQFFKRMFIF